MSFPANSASTGIQFCIRRDTGVVVPLVAADTLPYIPELYHIPRSMSAEQALEHRLTLLGSNGAQPIHAGPDSRAAFGSGSTYSPAVTPSNAPEIVNRPEVTRPYAEDEVEQVRQLLRRGVKIWCSKWLDTRDCAFQQQGCRYKHDIPPRSLWKELGFPYGRPWWHQIMSQDHIQKTMALLKSSPASSESGKSATSEASKGRPRVPVGSGVGDGAADQSSKILDQSTVMEEQSLIDFDDEDLASAASAARSEPPAAKKIKTESTEGNDAAAPESSPTTVKRAFVPAGESAAKHVNAARLHQHRRRRQQSPRPKPKSA